MTLIYELDLEMAKGIHRVKYLGQGSFRSTVVMRTHAQIHTAVIGKRTPVYERDKPGNPKIRKYRASGTASC